MSVAVQPSPEKEKIRYYPGPSYFVGRMTYDEYIAFEPESGPRFELINGNVYKIPDWAANHNRIGVNTARAIANQLDMTEVIAEALGSNQKIYINPKNAFYSDMSVVMDRYEADEQNALMNPALIVEVLSSVTDGFERGEKFEKYQTLPSLRHCLLIEQERVSVTHFEKLAGNLWAIVGLHNDLTESVRLTMGDAKITAPLTEIYRRMEFPERADETNDERNEEEE